MSGALRRCTRGRRSADRGVTIVEVVVAGALAALLAAATVGVFAGALRSMRLSAVRTATSADVRVAMEELTRELRVAAKPDGQPAALVSASPAAVTFYALLDRSGTPLAANVDLRPMLVAYTYDGTCLTVTLTPTTDSRGTPDATRASSRCVLRTPVAPVFSYFATGAISVGGVDVAPLDASRGLSTADLAATRSVEILLTGQNRADTDIPGTHLRSRVTLTNLVTGG